MKRLTFPDADADCIKEESLLKVLDCIHDSLRGLANALTAQEIRLSKLEKQLDSSVQMIESRNEIEKVARQRQNESGYL